MDTGRRHRVRWQPEGAAVELRGPGIRSVIGEAMARRGIARRYAALRERWPGLKPRVYVAFAPVDLRVVCGVPGGEMPVQSLVVAGCEPSWVDGEIRAEDHARLVDALEVVIARMFEAWVVDHG